MPRAEVGTPKWVANKMKSKGLQRLRWYCQVCEKQCRDENGFKCHAQSEAHLRQMLVVGENAGRHISDFTAQFQSEFVRLLSRRFGTKRVKANTVYQEYIQDKHHLHMNSTRWVTLSEFVKHLGRCGIAHVDETEKGWFLAWIDSSPKALAKQEASMKKERMKVSDEQRERNLLEEQIERAAAANGSGDEDSDKTPVKEEFKREEGQEKVVLAVSLKPVASSSTAESSAPAPLLKMNAFKAAKPAAVSNPLKRTNVFKAAASSTAASSSAGLSQDKDAVAGKKRDREQMSAAERIMFEDQERKRRKMDREQGRNMY